MAQTEVPETDVPETEVFETGDLETEDPDTYVAETDDPSRRQVCFVNILHVFQLLRLSD